MNLSDYKEAKPHRVKRLVWLLINSTIFRLLIGRLCWPLRRGLLMAFGATVDRQAYIYPSCSIFAPWFLTVGRACLGPRTEIYNKDFVVIGNDTVVSQGSKLYTATHDTSSLMLPLVTRPIVLENHVWVAADVFVGPGVTLGEGSVAGARSAVFRDVEPWTIVGGNPARVIKKRILNDT
ncbi:MAG: putative colanic acid biosynthesis acetyltransferase [Muribaculaceae bacterium]|nr:putative colanic acid biosynthesis acetyltransferase [Muribaculaceae bacterium]